MKQPKRILAATMFTDIAGYTALASHDEEKALEIIETQREILQPIVAEFNGEWLKEMGNGTLSSFHSAVDAVNCAIEIQKTVKEIEALNLSEIYVIVGEYEAAIDQLENLLSIPSPVSRALIRVDPLWDPLVEHPRFQSLIEQRNEY